VKKKLLSISVLSTMSKTSPNPGVSASVLAGLFRLRPSKPGVARMTRYKHFYILFKSSIMPTIYVCIEFLAF